MDNDVWSPEEVVSQFVSICKSSRSFLIIEYCVILQSIVVVLIGRVVSSILSVVGVVGVVVDVVVSSGDQFPHCGKLYGTGGKSECSPILNTMAIPISAWKSIWQWNSQ